MNATAYRRNGKQSPNFSFFLLIKKKFVLFKKKNRSLEGSVEAKHFSDAYAHTFSSYQTSMMRFLPHFLLLFYSNYSYNTFCETFVPFIIIIFIYEFSVSIDLTTETQKFKVRLSIM